MSRLKERLTAAIPLSLKLRLRSIANLGRQRDPLEQDHFSSHTRQGLKILVVDDHIPVPDRDAGSARMQLILKSLTQLGHCTFISVSKLPRPEYERRLREEGVEIAALADYPRLLKTRRFDVALMSRPDVAGAILPSIKRIAPGTKTIFDTVDIGFVRLEREFALTGNKQQARAARRFKKLETRLTRSCDQVWCVTEEDRMFLAREVPEAQFAIIPTIHPLQDRGKSFAKREGVLFIGNYLHRPNVDAVHYFMRDIYPAAREALPGLKLNIVGDNAPPEFASYASDTVKITGYLADVDPLFQECRIFIAPLRFGSGIKGKIGQALSYGLPVLTTSIGAEGMGFENERDVIIADQANEFAAGLTRLYTDARLWQRLSDSGYRHIAEHFTPEVVEEKIHQAILRVTRVSRA